MPISIGLGNGMQSQGSGGSTSASQNWSQSDAYNWAENSSNSYSSSMGTGAAASALSQYNAQVANRVNSENMAAVMAYNSAEAQKQSTN